VLSGWRWELLLFAILLGSGALLGYAAGYPATGVAAGLAVQLGLSANRLKLFQRWLSGNDLSTEPPLQAGVWGEVCDSLRAADRRHRRELEKSQESLQYLRDSYSALTDGVVILSRSNLIEWSNEAAGLMLGLRHPRDAGQRLTNLLRHPDLAQYLGRGDFADSLEMPCPVDPAKSLEVRVGLFGESSKLLFFRDLTALKRLETIRQDFLANISHELRTPLTVITGYLDTLRDVMPSESPVVDKILEQMQRQSARMENLLRDLMLLSTLEGLEDAQAGEEEMIAVCAMLESIRENALAACAGQRNIELDCAGVRAFGFRARRIQLEGIFSNIIFNAVKYTATGGNIRVRFWRDQDAACFSVTDDGIGIDPAHIPRLTERFYRVDKSRSLSSGGTGLGLAIVKHALKHLDGELEIRSKPGEGSTFLCRFPLERLVELPAGRPCNLSVTKAS